MSGHGTCGYDEEKQHRLVAHVPGREGCRVSEIVYGCISLFLVTVVSQWRLLDKTKRR